MNSSADSPSDWLSRPETLRDATASKDVISYTKTASGRTVQKTWGSNAFSLDLTSGGMDRFGRIVDLSFVSSTGTLHQYKYGYDKNNNRTFAYAEQRVNTNTRSYLYGYDRLNRLEYAERGKLEEQGDPFGTDYDHVDTGGEGRTWNLDLLGNWSADSGQQSRIDYVVGNASPATVGYDVADDGNPTTTRHHDTDGMNRIAEQFTDAASVTETAYDAAGNLVYFHNEDVGGTVLHSYDAWNRLVSVQEGTGLSIDVNGDLTGTHTGATIGSYEYDALGRRIAKNVDGQPSEYFYYDGDRMIEHYTDDGTGPTLKRQYLYGFDYIDEPVAVFDYSAPNGQVAKYVFQDANHNVVGVFQDFELPSAVERQFTYEPYGARLTTEKVNPGSGGGSSSKVASKVAMKSKGGATLKGGGTQESVEDVGSFSLLTDFGHQGLFHDAETGYVYNRGRIHAPRLARFLQQDPNETGLTTASFLSFNGELPYASPMFSQVGQYVDGMNLFAYLESNPNNRNDPSGLFSLPELINTTATSAYVRGSSFAATHPLAVRFTSGLMAGINLYAFAKYQEVQAIVIAQPNPGGILTAEITAVRLAMREVLRTAGSITGIAKASASSQRLANRALNTVEGLGATGARGGLYIAPGGKYSASERRAAKYVASLGRDVVLRPPSGARGAGGTSDLLVNGRPYDVYTPTSTTSTGVFRGIVKKKDQAVGVVVDLSRTPVSAHELGDVMARLRGKGVSTIQEVIFVPK